MELVRRAGSLQLSVVSQRWLQEGHAGWWRPPAVLWARERHRDAPGLEFFPPTQVPFIVPVRGRGRLSPDDPRSLAVWLASSPGRYPGGRCRLSPNFKLTRRAPTWTPGRGVSGACETCRKFTAQCGLTAVAPRGPRRLVETPRGVVGPGASPRRPGAGVLTGKYLCSSTGYFQVLGFSANLC